jgi:hypothetical protein
VDAEHFLSIRIRPVTLQVLLDPLPQQRVVLAESGHLALELRQTGEQRSMVIVLVHGGSTSQDCLEENSELFDRL